MINENGCALKCNHCLGFIGLKQIKKEGNMGEQLYVLNENGNIAGLKDRAEVHTNGLLHLAVQCWVMNQNGDVLIQRRSATKDKSAGKWDVSFGGHCSAVKDETQALISNVIKEGSEELGLTICEQDIIKLGEVRYTSQENKNREIISIYLTYVNNTQEFVFKDGEVSDVAWIKPDELKEHIVHNTKEYANRLGAISLLNFYIQQL